MSSGGEGPEKGALSALNVVAMLVSLKDKLAFFTWIHITGYQRLAVDICNISLNYHLNSAIVQILSTSTIITELNEHIDDLSRATITCDVVKC